MNPKGTLAVIAVVGSLCFYQASNWWERTLATLESSELSPDGCIRVDTYSPFWVLPSILHRIPHPDPEASPIPLGNSWDYPMFKRAYEASTGNLLGETIVYDATSSFDSMYWNESNQTGRRIVYSNGFPLLDSDRCSDKATLSKLHAYYEKARNDDPERMKEWDEYEHQWREDKRKREEQEHLLRLRPPAETPAGPSARAVSG
ncbi:hypothetical protein [Luteibacter sp.]|jgi:hypothetical protein|uniref:hypothetical protein n=1 Tax=Luteibacter sp. TaxID=1886636 RepID=UPI002F3ECC74